MNHWTELRDQALTEDILDCLHNDRRTDGLDLAVEVRGGVAHLSGMVSSEQERHLVRRLAGRVRGIHAVWDLVRTATADSWRVVDVGCGETRQHHSAIGVDRVVHPGVDLLADISRGLPFRTSSVDRVFAVHVLEHVLDVVALMNEIHRILRPSGVLHVLSPHWQNVIAVADPTHLHYFSPETFKYFCRPRPGLRAFWPLAVSATSDTVFADLQPVKDGAASPSDDVLARVFY